MAANPIFQGKRSTSGTHHGLRDWLMQRATAVLMLLFTFVVIARVLLVSGPITYDAWAGVFAPIDYETAMAAAREVSVKSKWFPSVADIMNEIGSSKGDGIPWRIAPP